MTTKKFQKALSKKRLGTSLVEKDAESTFETLCFPNDFLFSQLFPIKNFKLFPIKRKFVEQSDDEEIPKSIVEKNV